MGRIILLFAGMLLFATTAKALTYQEMFPFRKDFSEEEKAVLSKLNFQQGAIKLSAAKATLNIPPNFYYLSPDDATHVLIDIWHNPPSAAEGTSGMIFPAKYAPTDADAWGSIVEYDDDGYVSDEDAESTNYDDLLQNIKSSLNEQNDERVKKGFSKITLVGWASPPHYDRATHALHWARDLIFGEDQGEHTLNYSVRILGRSGVFQFDFIAGVSQLKEIQDAIPQVTKLVAFDTGANYLDYRDGDRTATYTVAGLIAAGAGAKIAAKIGLFAVALLFFKKAGIVLLVAAAAVWRFFKRMLGRNTPPT